MEKFFCCLLVLVMAIATAASMPAEPPAVSPAPGMGGDCSTVIYNMADCLSFLGVPSNQEKPSKACCSGFKSVLDFDPECICEALESSKGLGIELNMTKAKTLPHQCKIKTPPMSCTAGSAPAPAPAPGDYTPSAPPASGGGDSEAAAPSKSDGGSLIMSSVFLDIIVILSFLLI